MSDLRARLRTLGLLTLSSSLDDLVALATKKRWGPTDILEHVADLEEKDRARRGLERRMSRSRLERFKPMADFDWNWPSAIDRPLVESRAVPAVGQHLFPVTVPQPCPASLCSLSPPIQEAGAKGKKVGSTKGPQPLRLHTSPKT